MVPRRDLVSDVINSHLVIYICTGFNTPTEARAAPVGSPDCVCAVRVLVSALGMSCAAHPARRRQARQLYACQAPGGDTCVWFQSPRAHIDGS